MKNEKEYRHAETAERIEERREERDGRKQVSQDIQQVEDELPYQQSRDQKRSDKCQQRGVLQSHGGIINFAGGYGNPADWVAGYFGRGPFVNGISL
jgi:hypothetical protein